MNIPEKKRHNVFIYEGAFQQAKKLAWNSHRSIVQQIEYIIEEAYKKDKG